MTQPGNRRSRARAASAESAACCFIKPAMEGRKEGVRLRLCNEQCTPRNEILCYIRYHACIQYRTTYSSETYTHFSRLVVRLYIDGILKLYRVKQKVGARLREKFCPTKASPGCKFVIGAKQSLFSAQPCTLVALIGFVDPTSHFTSINRIM